MESFRGLSARWHGSWYVVIRRLPERPSVIQSVRAFTCPSVHPPVSCKIQRLRAGFPHLSAAIHEGSTKDLRRTHERPAKDPRRTYKGATKDSRRIHEGPAKDPRRTHEGPTKDPRRTHDCWLFAVRVQMIVGCSSWLLVAVDLARAALRRGRL